MSNPYWQQLELAPTTDRKAVKRAFAARVKVVRPEDDPEAYQALRQAYEWAMEIGIHLTDAEHDPDEDEWPAFEIPAQLPNQEMPTQADEPEDENQLPSFERMNASLLQDIDEAPEGEAVPVREELEELDDQWGAELWPEFEEYEDDREQAAGGMAAQILNLLDEEREEEALEAYRSLTEEPVWQETEFRVYFETFILVGLLEVTWSTFPRQFADEMSRAFGWREPIKDQRMWFEIWEIKRRLRPMELEKEIQASQSRRVGPLNVRGIAIDVLLGPYRPIYFHFLYRLGLQPHVCNLVKEIATFPGSYYQKIRESKSYQWWVRRRKEPQFDLRGPICLANGWTCYYLTQHLELIGLGMSVVLLLLLARFYWSWWRLLDQTG